LILTGIFLKVLKISQRYKKDSVAEKILKKKKKKEF